VRCVELFCFIFDRQIGDKISLIAVFLAIFNYIYLDQLEEWVMVGGHFGMMCSGSWGDAKTIQERNMQLHSIRCFAVAGMAGLLGVLGLTVTEARGQMASNTARNMRPLVWVKDSSSASNATAVGIFDTGNPDLYVAPETNSLWKIAPTAATAGNDPSDNDNIVGADTNFTVGGFLGGGVNGPEVGAPPTHTFTSVSSLGNTSQASATDIAPSLTYFNGLFSMVNIGGAFYNSNGGGASPLVAEVDPTNATWVPFPFNNIAAGATNGGTPAGALKAPRSIIDQATPNISFYNPGSASAVAQIPTIQNNNDPGFMIAIPLTPTNPNTNVKANSFTNAVGMNNSTLGMDANYTTPATNVPLGLAANTTYTIDTGAPTTGFKPALGVNLLGADILNGFGQYFDFNNKELLLFGPTLPQDQSLVGPGILFTVDQSTTGLAGTGVNQLATNGSIPVNNAATSAAAGKAIQGDGVAGQQASGIYRTQLTHSNAAYISGVSALKLAPSDQINGLSMGSDTPGIPTGGIASAVLATSQTQAAPADVSASALSGPGSVNCALLFSVDQNSTGLNASGVAGQTALGKQSANMYLSVTGNYLKNQIGTNSLKYSGDLLGLGPNSGPSSSAAGRGHVDHLGDFVVNSQNGYYSSPFAPGPVDPATVQRNTDPTITALTGSGPANQAFNPGAGVTLATSAGSPTNAGRGDQYGSTFDTYFTLNNGSASLTSTGDSGADILVNNQAGTGQGFHIFAFASQMGLKFHDGIDALALSRPQLGEINLLARGKPNPSTNIIMGSFDEDPFGDFEGVDAFHDGVSDYALFSLAPGSPDLGIYDPVIGRKLSAADVFVSDFDNTFALYATAESLGLNPTDNITGLKPVPLSAVPEPMTLGLLGFCAIAMLGRRRRG
jgi:hypothetical protein